MDGKNPQIIHCAGLFFYTTRFHGAVTTLLPAHLVNDTDLLIGGQGEDSYFAVLLSDSSPEGEAKVRAALDYVWSRLIDRGLATGAMPEPVEGNPLKMLH